MIQTTTTVGVATNDSVWRVRPRVSPRVAAEAPRMFSSFSRVLRELFQNAFRAGATRVNVQWDSAASILEIEDDGAGIEDPQILLDAGASGWDQAQFVEPAGLGFFALFNPAYVEWIEATSRGAGNWRMRLAPDDIRRAVQDQDAWIHVEPIAATNGQHGLTIRLRVTERERRQVNRDLLGEARAQYPYTVRYTEDEKTMELEPRAFGFNLNVVETSVGRIEWEVPYGVGYRSGCACWEYVPFFSHHLTKALEEAAQNHPLGALAEIAAHSLTMWYIDPKCGVRPQLPERSELIDDDALRTAATVIVENIANDMLARAREDFRDAPARIESTHATQERFGKWLERGKFSHVLLKCLGYAFVEKHSGEVWIEMLDEDSWRAHMNATHIYSRTAQIVGSERLAATLNFMGHEVAYEEGAPIPQIHIAGQRTDVEKCPFVALAQRIEIDGIGAVPFLIEEYVEDRDIFTRIVFAGDAEQCVAWFHRQEFPIAYLFVANDNSEWTSRDGDDVTFERAQALEEISTCIAQAWSPELEAALHQHYDLKRAIAMLEEAEGNLEAASRWLGKQRTPTTNLARRSLEGVKARMEYVREIMSEANRVSAPVPLQNKTIE